MNFESIADFVYEIIAEGFSICVVDDKIKLQQPPGQILSDTNKAFIVNNKQNMVSFLRLNQMHSHRSAPTILRQDSRRARLSFSQERLWFMHHYAKQRGLYNIPRVYEVCSSVDVARLKLAIKDVVHRHQVLRSRVQLDNAGTACLVADPMVDDHLLHDYVAHDQNDCERLLSKECQYDFDLQSEYPIRVCFYQTSSARFMSIVVHHIAFDGWSIGILANDLHRFYVQRKSGVAGDNLDPLPIEYIDYAVWQHRQLSCGGYGAHLAYWKNALQGYEQLRLPIDDARPTQQTYEGETTTFSVTTAMTANIKLRASELKVSLYHYVLSAFYVSLSLLCNQQDIVVGTVMANRHCLELDQMIGLLSNTLAMRCELNMNASLWSHVQRVSENCINAQAYQDLPFEKVIDELHVPIDSSMNPIFQVMFAYQHFSHPDSQPLADLLKQQSTNDMPITAKFDLTVSWHDDGETLSCQFNYRTGLFNASTISRYLSQYFLVITRLLDCDDLSSITLGEFAASLSDADRITPNERVPYPSNDTLLSLFEQQTQRTPEAIAVIDAAQDRSYSYSELRMASRCVAGVLLSQPGACSGRLVAILSEKGMNHAVSVLAVLTSGQAFLPLHAEWPIERLQAVLRQGDVHDILISSALYQRDDLRSALSKVARLHVIESAMSLPVPVETRFPEIHATDIAYVIFTSGSTGTPKGVTISHQGAMNTIFAVNQRYAVDGHDKVLALSALSFDLAIYDVFGPLHVGATVVFPDSALINDVDHWQDLVTRFGVTVWNTVPQLAQLLVSHDGESLLPSLRLFLLSGDWIPLGLPDRIKQVSAQSAVVSLGGATEGSIWSIWYEIGAVDSSWKSIPYGYAMPNQQLFVMTDQHTLCAEGVVGEIVIGGDGVALHYWGDHEKTTMSFVDVAGFGRIYKTGDLGRLHADGYIEFVGRKDTQVKINGYRIELDDVASHVLSLDGVVDSTVVVFEEDGVKKLVAYYTGELHDEATCHHGLSMKLPEYMLPARIVHLDAFPLTANGKLDRKALPKPSLRLHHDYVEPRTALEAQLREIYAEVLGLSPGSVGVRDDFFRLGGDSIGSMRLVSAIKKRMGLIVSVKSVFQLRTIEKLSVESQSLPNQTPVAMMSEQGKLTGDVPLHPVQQWFFEQDLGQLSHFNHGFLVAVPTLDAAVLQVALTRLSEQHDALRLRFRVSKEKVTAHYDEDTRIPLHEPDGFLESTTAVESYCHRLQTQFNLTQGPLCLVALIRQPNHQTRLLMVFHHLIVDAVSWRLLVNDLKVHYLAVAQGERATVPNKGTSYRQWSQLLCAYQDRHPNECHYWREALHDYTEYKALTRDLWTSSTSHSNARLNAQLTSSLLKDVSSAYHTEINDLLLSCLNVALSELTGSDVNYITLEGHGREEVFAETDCNDTVGWFTAMYPVRLETLNGFGLGGNIKLMKENLRSIPNKGVGYLPLMGSQDLPPVCFNYLGQLSDTSDVMWGITSEPVGQTMAESNTAINHLTMNVVIEQGELVVYARGLLPNAALSHVCQRYVHHLGEMVAYLLSQTTRQVTMSDYPDFETHAIVNENEAPLMFMFPPGVGGYESYLSNIANKIESRLVLFNNFNHFLKNESDDKVQQGLSFSTLAETYIAKMKTIQPKGPYCLFGWSFGGVLAFEIARHFKLAGEKVAHLYMVDSYFDVSSHVSELSLSEEEQRLVGDLHLSYNPGEVSLGQEINVTLFRASNMIKDQQEAVCRIMNHYVNNINLNGFDKIYTNPFNLVPIDASHFDWINNEDVIKHVGSYITKDLQVA